AFLGQPLDFAQRVDILLGITALPAPLPRRGDQAEAVILAQGLGVHVSQFGGHRNHENRRIHIYPHGGTLPPALCAFAARSFRPAETPTRYNRALAARLPRGSDPAVAAAKALTASWASLPRFCGTTTSMVTSKSPVFFAVFTPRPFTRSVRPDGVPAGTLTLTKSPASVGTSICAPRAASGNVTGTWIRMLSPSRWKKVCGLTLTVTIRSPAPAGPGWPLPRTRTFWPSLMPAGIRTSMTSPLGSRNPMVVPLMEPAKEMLVLAVRSAPLRGACCW